MISKGANVKDKYVETALMWASKEGHKEVVELLIEKGADVNARDNAGWTALMDASYNGHKEIVELLLEKGADFKIRNKNGKTALSIAINDKTRDAINKAIQKRNIKEKGMFWGSIKNLFER